MRSTPVQSTYNVNNYDVRQHTKCGDKDFASSQTLRYAAKKRIRDFPSTWAVEKFTSISYSVLCWSFYSRSSFIRKSKVPTEARNHIYGLSASRTQQCDMKVSATSSVHFHEHHLNYVYPLNDSLPRLTCRFLRISHDWRAWIAD